MLRDFVRGGSRVQENCRPAADKLRRLQGDFLLLGVVADTLHRVIHLGLIDSAAMAALDQTVLLKLLQIPPDRHVADVQLLRQFLHLYASVILYHS